MSRYSKNLGVFVLCLLFLGNSLLYSQDTLKVVKIKKQKHSPLVATLMSTAVPGLGQIYNKKYWKTPIIYVGFGVLTYFFITNYDEYSIYRNEYLYIIKGDTSNLNV